MLIILFIIIAVLYHISLACIDAFFNKMIRRNIKDWENLPEFEWITVFLLIGGSFIPLAMLWIISPFHAIVYGICFCFVQWDLIFGKIVYGEWFKDQPMLKVRGKWRKISLVRVILLRAAIGTSLLITLLIWFDVIIEL